MATSRLLLSTDLSADAPVIAAGTVVPGEYERLRDALDSRSPGLSSLFAEPVFGSKTPTGYRNASWYAGLEGEPVALTALPEAVRPAVGQQLAARLAELRPLMEEPSLGPLLRHALLVPSLDAVQVVGNHIVLVKWGFVPSSLPQSQDALERHFKATLGALTGQPWLSGPQAPEAPQAQAIPPHAFPPQGGPVPTAPGLAPVGGDGGAPPEPPPQAPDAPPPPERASPYPDRGTGYAGAGVGAGVVPVAVLPWYARSAVVLPLLVLFLLIGLLIGLLLCGFRPFGWRTASGLGLEDQRAIQSGVVDSLREERDRLKGLLSGDVCRADTAALPQGALSLPVRPSLPPSAAPPSASPPPASSSPATGAAEARPAVPPANATPPSGKPGERAAVSLNDYLEKSTVMIVTEEGLGSGFFIGPDLIITNRHVVELQSGRIAGSLMVTSKSLGRLYPGKVQVSSANSEFGQRDYAVIRLTEAPSPAPMALPLAQSVEKRATVIAAGYPGYLVQQDPAMVRLKQGDMSAAPELVLSEGKVQVIHVPQGGVPVVVHSADISQGNSGGPLVDDCGRVVAINTFIGMDEASGRRGLFSLGSSDLIAFLQQSQIAMSVDGASCTPLSR